MQIWLVESPSRIKRNNLSDKLLYIDQDNSRRSYHMQFNLFSIILNTGYLKILENIDLNNIINIRYNFSMFYIANATKWWIASDIYIFMLNPSFIYYFFILKSFI